ncbi:MAG: DUF1849 family protein [Alphaproteobacteria bacterium]|nr:DUF1849 family protein [Alphaproteobacteria bacterium]
MHFQTLFKNPFLIAGVVLATLLITGTHLVIAGAASRKAPESADEKTSDRDGSRSGSRAVDGFVPHKALYEIDLIGAHSGSQVLNISGQMFFKWETACDAWITDHRFKLIYEYADSPAMRITSDFSTFETFDGKSFDFTSSRKRDGELYEELRGRAVLRDDGGEAVYTVPEGLEYDLTPGTLFPMAHTAALLDALHSEKKFFTATVFDGSDEEGPVLINAFIGERVNVMARMDATADIDASLLNTPAYDVRMAFFPLKEYEAAADYEMSVVFHENGIISDMVIEYDDFTIAQKLIALERLQPDSCDVQKK